MELYDDQEELSNKPKGMELVSYITGHLEGWRSWRDANYLERWKEYERLWRGIWAAEDKMRESERSQIITPALQQAIETRHAEIMEAVFGNGEFFDINDDVLDADPTDIEQLKSRLMEDFKTDKIRKSVEAIELLAEVYGTGIGEIVVSRKKVLSPITDKNQPVAPGLYVSGVQETERFGVGLVPVNPKNFLIDPNATSVEDALGVAIERFVPLHDVVRKMEDGIYRKCAIGTDASDTDLEPTQEAVQYNEDKVRLITYYGLVPRKLLSDDEDADVIDLFPADPSNEAAVYEDLVEAIVVIANGSYLLKAEESPYMMQDRPVVAYQDDTVPGRFHGRGTAEKGYNMQKANDAQWRAWLDSLALTSAPMVAMDATRMPRGAKFEVRPGKQFLTNGNPSEIVFPFKFGETDPNNLLASEKIERMLLQATATVDSAGMPSSVPRDAQAGGLSMALAGIIKKYKRTLSNFQEDFLIPFVTKAVWRYMQFDPARYPMTDVKFIPAGSLGIMAREYEQSQMIGLMQTLGPDSAIVPVLLKSVIQHSGLRDREALAKQLEQMSQPDPAQAQFQQQMQQMQLAMMQAQLQEVQAKAAKAQADAGLKMVEAQLKPVEVQADLIAAANSNNVDPLDKQFDRRVKVAEVMLKERDIESNEEIAKMQMRNKSA